MGAAWRPTRLLAGGNDKSTARAWWLVVVHLFCLARNRGLSKGMVRRILRCDLQLSSKHKTLEMGKCCCNRSLSLVRPISREMKPQYSWLTRLHSMAARLSCSSEILKMGHLCQKTRIGDHNCSVSKQNCTWSCSRVRNGCLCNRNRRHGSNYRLSGPPII